MKKQTMFNCEQCGAPSPAVITSPENSAKCPYCGGRLIVKFANREELRRYIFKKVDGLNFKLDLKLSHQYPIHINDFNYN